MSLIPIASTVLARLDVLVAAGEIQSDRAQRDAAIALDALAGALKGWRAARRTSITRLFGGAGPNAPRGLYIWGQVGRGKTMLMDMFHESVEFKPRRRIHFHEFMAEVHDRIGAARAHTPGDPIPHVAKAIAAEASLLCFDEFHVTDIADAMILGRLFTALFASEVVVVATSNVSPQGLYKDGLNRQLFVPFIDLLAAKTTSLELVSAKDFRLEKLAGHPLYFSPLDRAAQASVRESFTRLSGAEKGQPRDLEVKGRKVHVPEAANGVALFDFDDLCMKPLGALDYLHIAHAFHTLVITNVPALNRDRRAEARRFITLIDTLYDARVGLIMSAAAEPDEIYPRGDEAFLFERTASRLIEMRSESYLNSREERKSALNEELVDTTTHL
jgi:cell division protein ZapE